MNIDPANTAWVLTSTALVLLMTPALGLFYGGLVRRKNVLNTLIHSMFLLGAISVQWALIGYTLSFGSGSVVGGLEHAGLNGVAAAPDPLYSKTIPASAFMAFQMAFAVITPALISGAYAERMRFSAFALFSLAWATLVYDPIAHWVWGDGGWLRNAGVLDFAGGTVVHISSGVSALVCAAILGRGTHVEEKPHNTVLTLLGAGLLWIGWFGFNAGSSLAADGIAATAFVNTHLAASAGAITWVGVTWFRTRKVSALAVGLGSVAGLVAITPAAGFVTPMASLLFGSSAAAVCSVACDMVKARVHDRLDVFAVHGVGGMLGAVLTGVFCTTSVNPAAADASIHQVLLQIGAVLVVSAFSAVMTVGILKVLGLFLDLRLPDGMEHHGIDDNIHGEAAYRL